MGHGKMGIRRARYRSGFMIGMMDDLDGYITGFHSYDGDTLLANDEGLLRLI